MADTRILAPCDPIQLGQFFLEDRRFPAVYFLYHRGELVYVGQSKTLKSRIDTHMMEGRKKFDSVAFFRCPVNRLTELEGHYIRQFAPEYNACGLSNQMRSRAAWTVEQNREGARKKDAFFYHIEASATCGTVLEDGECYIHPKDFGKFLMITDQDAATLLAGVKEPVPVMDLMLWCASNRELRAAQGKFEDL